MKILTISIDGQSRAELLRALVDVMEEIHRGTDSASYMNEKLSMSFNIREYDLPGEVPTARSGQIIDITPKSPDYAAIQKQTL
jgi:hypothetical protein